MLLALFYEKNKFYGKRNLILRVGSFDEIRNQLAELNGWQCLIRCGREMGTPADQPELDKLQGFLANCNDRKSMENFYISVSTGELGVIMVAEISDDIESMFKKVIPEVLDEEPEYQEQLNAIFDKIKEYISSGKEDKVATKFASMQFLTSGIARDDYLEF